jgi:hypothetical protein
MNGSAGDCRKDLWYLLVPFQKYVKGESEEREQHRHADIGGETREGWSEGV